MESTEINNLIFLNYLFNYIITKIDDCKIEHKHNIKMFILDCDNLIENETIIIMKSNSQ
jgi:hypothetical protein